MTAIFKVGLVIVIIAFVLVVICSLCLHKEEERERERRAKQSKDEEWHADRAERAQQNEVKQETTVMMSVVQAEEKAHREQYKEQYKEQPKYSLKEALLSDLREQQRSAAEVKTKQAIQVSASSYAMRKESGWKAAERRKEEVERTAYMTKSGMQNADAESVQCYVPAEAAVKKWDAAGRRINEPTQNSFGHIDADETANIPSEAEWEAYVERSLAELAQKEKTASSNQSKSACVQKPDGVYYHSIEAALQAQNVPTGYQKIMIVRMEGTDIRECPALIWKEEAKAVQGKEETQTETGAGQGRYHAEKSISNQKVSCDEILYVFPLRKGAGLYRWSLKDISIIVYEKRRNPDMDALFAEVAQSNIAAAFAEEFPTYPFDEAGMYTGTFSLPNGLEVSNTSGKALFALLSAKFYVVDEVMQDARYEKEIRELYKAQVLKENGVIDYKRYEQEKRKYLQVYEAREQNREAYAQQMQFARDLGLI